MRQIGVICAAALVALEENVAKLEGDHKKAKTLAGSFFCYGDRSICIAKVCYLRPLFV